MCFDFKVLQHNSNNSGTYIYIYIYIHTYIYIYISGRTLYHLQHNSSTNEFTSCFYKNSSILKPVINSWWCALYMCTVIFLICLLNIYTVDVEHICFCISKFLEMVFYITIFKMVLYQNSYF